MAMMKRIIISEQKLLENGYRIEKEHNEVGVLYSIYKEPEKKKVEVVKNTRGKIVVMSIMSVIYANIVQITADKGRLEITCDKKAKLIFF